MAYIESGWSNGWKPSGSSYTKYYCSWLNYDVYTYADSVVVYAYMGVRINSSVSASYSAQLAATGQTTYSGSGSTTYHSDGSGKSVTIIGTRTYTWSRTTSNQTKYVSASIASSNGSWNGTWVTCSAAINIPALGAYAVSYDANGGSGSVEGQTKYYNINLTLSDGTGFSWKNHTLTGWNTKADGTGTAYALGDTYTGNSALTLYAQWDLNAVTTYTKISGAIKEGILYVKVNGAIKIPYAGYVKVNGHIEQIGE